MQVFVSSTVYDLLDVRAELQNALRQMGCSPVMSDVATSDFDTLPQTNSIETCLVNLRSSDVVIVVLCRRYGSRLGDSFSNLSATHVEYREAVKEKKRILFFVRDRLQADYDQWKKTDESDRQSLDLSWVRSEKDRGLFNLIGEHSQLSGQQERSNWVTNFRDSTDLRQIVAMRLQVDAFRARFDQLLQTGRLPVASVSLELERYERNKLRLVVNLLNAGEMPMYSVIVDGDSGNRRLLSDSTAWIPPRGTQCYTVGDVSEKNVAEFSSLTVSYSLSNAFRCRDRFEVFQEVDMHISRTGVGGRVLRANLSKRQFGPGKAETPDLEILTEEKFDSYR